MHIRPATRSDINNILENRIQFVSDLGELHSNKQFEENTLSYLENHIDDENLIIWLAIENAEIISIAILSIYEVLPTVANLSGKTGYLLNVWTDDKYR